MTPGEAARELNVSTRTVSRYAERGLLTRLYSPLLRHPRYDAKEVKALVKRRAEYRSN